MSGGSAGHAGAVGVRCDVEEMECQDVWEGREMEGRKRDALERWVMTSKCD